MRRFIPLLAALLILGALPGVAAAANDRCSIEVTPSSGNPTDVYRINGSNIPVDPDGGSVEVHIHIKRLGTRAGAMYFLHLIPGTTEFYLDLNQPAPGEPVEPMEPGRYLVLSETDHGMGCRDVDMFVID